MSLKLNTSKWNVNQNVISLSIKGFGSSERPWSFFWMKTIFRVKKWSFFVVNIFHFGCHYRIQYHSKGFNGFLNTKTTSHLFIYQSSHKKCPPIQWQGQHLLRPEEYFLGSSKEKRTVTAQARRGETPPTRTAPSGWRTPCWQGPFSNPPASSSWWSIAFILSIFFRYKSSVCGLVWLAGATAARKIHDLSI